jgi:hypothetical protein
MNRICSAAAAKCPMASGKAIIPAHFTPPSLRFGVCAAEAWI